MKDKVVYISTIQLIIILRQVVREQPEALLKMIVEKAPILTIYLTVSIKGIGHSIVIIVENCTLNNDVIALFSSKEE